MKAGPTKALLPLTLSLLCTSETMLAQEPTQLLWGDTHLHTSNSVDAFMAGNRNAGPDVAYRYAKGEPVLHPFAGNRVQIDQPLDFLAVADHAEYLGVVHEVMLGDAQQPEAGFFEKIKSWAVTEYLRHMISDPVEGTKRFTKLLPEPEIQSGDRRDPIEAAIKAGTAGGLESIGLLNVEAAKRISASRWSDSMRAADRHYEPGKFTTLVGWEWTQTASGANLHRVVVADVDGETATEFDPIGSDDAPYPEQLWDGLSRLEGSTGGTFVSIPHNSNLSKGYMFSKTTLSGEAMNAAYASKRARWEPMVEATQIKGDSETHPTLSPDDEFADFERFDFYLQAFPQAKGYKAQKGDTIRSALQNGLELEAELGVNPFKFGLIGSTDAHTSVASAEEPNFWGKVATDSLPINKRRADEDGYADGKQSFNGWTMSASGLAAVWAKENTRESIVEAFKRRETYATTGPRIQVRLFAGWNYTDEDLQSADFVNRGYSGGVPMGGDLTRASNNERRTETHIAPRFMIRASKGPQDHNLDRVQIIKSWLNDDGLSQEKIFDVAWAGDRQPGNNGKLPAIGNSTNLRTGVTSNTIGAVELATVWTDPEFNADQRAVYYARVLQIPTIRHSQLDATALGMGTPHEGPATIQERAYTSPVWYTP